jgi:hypothetical protein
VRTFCISGARGCETRMNESTREVVARHTFPKPTALPSFWRAHKSGDGKPSAWETERGNDSIFNASNCSPLGELRRRCKTFVRERVLTLASTRNSPLPHGRGSKSFVVSSRIGRASSREFDWIALDWGTGSEFLVLFLRA